MTYSDKLKDPRWQKKRLEILNRDNFTCTLCLDKESTLNIHHLKYTGNPWDTPNECLITLCEDCHSFIEFYKNDFNIIVTIKVSIVDGNVCIVGISDESVITIALIKNNKISHCISLSEKSLKDITSIFNNHKLKTIVDAKR